MSIKIYHNPRCSKSRQTLALLQNRGLEVQVIRYLESKPGFEELRGIARALGIHPRQLLRSGETEYKTLGLDRTDLSGHEILMAIEKHPQLLQRPIVVCDGSARIGRPPEAVLEIIE